MASLPDILPAIPGGPLWVDGAFTLRLRGPGPDRLLEVRRPFALVGRIAGCDLQINDRAVSARHVYLHLDRRGLFGVDLATRTGTRFDPNGRDSGRIRPGQGFEVAGRRIELVEMRLDEELPRASSEPDDLLADSVHAPLIGVTLHAMHSRHAPRALGSELVFIGRGDSCGVRIEGATASRVHGVLVRSANSAYIVDLIGRGTWLNGQPVIGASALRDGDTLAIGSAQFGIRLTPPSSLPAHRADGPPQVPGFPEIGLPPMPSSVPAEAQGAVLAWMMGALQAGQSEILRRQGEFHLALTRLVQQMQQDNAEMLKEHLDRMERIDRELAGLRAEIYRRFGSAEAASAQARGSPSRPSALPSDLRIEPVPKPPETDSAAAAAWLIRRVGQLEDEQRSTWKDMVGRLTGRSG